MQPFYSRDTEPEGDVVVADLQAGLGAAAWEEQTREPTRYYWDIPWATRCGAAGRSEL